MIIQLEVPIFIAFYFYCILAFWCLQPINSKPFIGFIFNCVLFLYNAGLVPLKKLKLYIQ